MAKPEIRLISWLILTMVRYSIVRLPALETGLTNRQQEVLRLMADGLSTQEIALELGISEETVRSHIAALVQKLDCANRSQVPLRAAELGVLERELENPTD
jgi:RNA polymerase sigma factor (sigma-70 family)